jgi:Rrf2 family protein
MISQTVEYALRAIVTIAQHQGAAVTAQKIAAITRVPAPYLSKLMQGLVRNGVVRSQRGVHGGFVLTKDPTQLTVLDVVDSVDPIRRILECPLGISSHGDLLCPLHRRLDNALQSIEQLFRVTTIAELLSDAKGSIPLCQDHTVLSIHGDSTAAPTLSSGKTGKP